MIGQHLDLDELADLLASGYDPTDVGGPADAGSVADPAALAHVSSCLACTAELQSLERAQQLVSAALAGLADPPLPTGLAARLDAALARERSGAAVPQPATTAWPAGQPSASAARGTVLPLRRRRSRWQPWAAGAAAAAVLGTGGVLLTRTGGARSSTSSSAVSSLAGGAAAGPAVPTSNTGADYRSPAALAVALPALLRGFATAPRPASTVTGIPGQGTGPAATPPDASPQLHSEPQLDRLRQPEALADCLAALQSAGNNVRPLALDYARYAGAPALIVVLPSPRTDQVDVYAVGPACSAADARVLSFSRLTSP